MPDGAIDNLSIQIGASSTEAVREINKLATSLKDLKTQLSGIGNASFGKKFSDSMSALAGAMKSVKSEDISKLRQVASAIKTFEGVKDIKINSTFAQKLTDVAAAADLIKEEHANKLIMFGNAIKSLQGEKISISSKLPEQLKNIGDAVSQIADETVRRLDEMTQAIARLNGIDLKGFSSAVKAASNATNAKAKESAKPSTDVSGKVSQQVDEAMRALSGSSSETLGYISDVGKELLGNVLPAVAAFGTAMKTVASVAKQVWGHVKKLAKDMVKIAANRIKKFVDNSAIGGVIKLGNAFDRLKKSIGRVAFYRVIRSAIKYVTDMLKEGTNNAYWFAREYGDATAYIADAFDNLSSAQFKMSNQLGAAWSTMIATIEPILMRLINLVTKAADAVTQLFALLSGKGVYMKAVDYNKQWADAADKASGSAKEWKNQLLGFDEINRLEAPSDTGRGSGANDYTDYENMFEEMPVSDFFAQIKEAFESGEWATLGQLLGDKFNEIIDSIKWDEYGKKLGKGIQGIVSTAYNFLKTANFVNLGERLAEFINNAIDQINFKEAGHLAMRLHTALWDIFYGAIVELDWADLATGLSNFVIGALGELADWLEGLDPHEIATAIKDFFGNIKGDEISAEFKRVVKDAFELALSVTEELFPDGLLPTLAKGVGNFIKKIFESLNDEDFQEAHNILQYRLDSAFFGKKWADFWWSRGEYAGKEIVMGLIHGEGYVAKDFQESTNTFLATPVNEVFESINTDAGNTSQVMDNMKQTTIDAVTGASESYSALQTKGTELFTGLEESATKYNDTFTQSFQGATESGTTFMTEFDEAVQEHSESIVGSMQNMIDKTQEFQGMFGGGYTGESTSEGSTETAVSGDVQATGFGGIDAIITKLKELADQASATQEAYALMATTISETITALDATFSSMTESWQKNTTTVKRFANEMSESVVNFQDTVERMVANNISNLSNMVVSFDEAKLQIVEGLSKVSQTMRALQETWRAATYSMASDYINFAYYVVDASVYVIEALMLVARAALKAAMAMMFLAMMMSVLGMGGGMSVQQPSGIGIDEYANGGFPENGQLFIANENGAGSEMIGTVGGKTAVVNNEDIVAAVSMGVAEAVSNVLASNGGRGKGDVVLNVNGREFMRAIYDDQMDVARERGTSLVSNA